MTLMIQGVDVYLEEMGVGSPTLFLHGAPDSADLWSGVIVRLEDKYQCFAPDLPGFGRSAAPGDFVCTLDNMARFIDELVESAGMPTPLNLVVADFGATYGLAWAVKHPQKVRRIAVAGGSNFSSRYRWHSTARMLRLPVLGELVMASVTFSSFKNMMRQNAPLLSEEQVRKTFDISMGKPETRRMMLKLYRSLDSHSFVGWEDRFHELTKQVPTLVLWGDKDAYVVPEHAESFGVARVEHFPQNSHWLAEEIPETVAERLAPFFA